MKKFLKNLKREYILKIFKKIFLLINIDSRNSIYVHRNEYRSNSERSFYLQEVINSIKSQNNFNYFKRNNFIKSIVETVKEKKGAEYLKVLESRNDGILDKALNTVLIEDEVGSPLRYNYKGYELPLSPTTLRYLKVTSDLKKLFGKDFKRVAEIGCGYGGQALINDQLLNIESVKLFDLPMVNKLIEKYLNSYCLNGSYRTTILNQEMPQDYDLVISNYAFSEMPKILQIKYIEKVISRAKRGYLTMNTGGEKNYDKSCNKLTINEIRKFIPEIKVLEEEPLTWEYNYIIVWGFNNIDLNDYFRIKDI